MKNPRWLLLAAMLAIPSLSLAQTAGANAAKSGSNSDFEQVSELNRQWLKAAVAHHTDFMEQLFADDFVEMHHGGEVVSKKGQIDQTGKYRVLRVFVKQQGKWRAAGAALTLMPAPQSSAK